MYDAKLLSEVAGLLAGKPVTVRLRAPCLQGAIGCATTSKKTGAHYIDIDPDLHPSEFLRVFLHETAHHLYSHPKPSDWCDMPPHSVSARVTAYSASLKDREDPAERQAAAWLKCAEEDAGRFRGDWMAQRLKALELMRFRPIIDAAVNLALHRVEAKRQAQSEILARRKGR
jgi:hypothetical protein